MTKYDAHVLWLFVSLYDLFERRSYVCLCTQIQCIGADCSALMHRDEILARLGGADKARYAQFLVDANCDPLRRTCPRCSHVLTVDGDLLATGDKLGVMVTCAECQLDWCFPCHAPWHAHMRCSDFRRGDKLLKAWAREQHYGQVNAQKCPKCKVTRRAPVLTFLFIFILYVFVIGKLCW